VSYNLAGNQEQAGAEVVHNTLNFLTGREAYDKDLILIVEEGRSTP
jgi:hypothetical protein